MGEGEERRGAYYGATLSKNDLAAGWRIDEDGYLYLDHKAMAETAAKYRKNKKTKMTTDAKAEDEQRKSERNGGK
jgi:hypothetical protein